jgi:hypothetical protein
MKKHNRLIIHYISSAALLIMLFINFLANILPMNGMTTSEVSDLYFNLFAPSDLTASIEILIYILFIAYILYQFGLFRKGAETIDAALTKKIGIYFTISALANALWTISWHYEKLAFSVLLMLIILFCMFVINWKIHKQKLTEREKLFVKLPFSIYFSWTTVATIANIIAFLSSIGWKGCGISPEVWTVVGISIGMLAGSAVIVINKDIAYGMGLLWAYVGILIKHIYVFGFAGKYPLIINTVNICIILIAIFQAHVFFSGRVKEKRE